MTIKNGLAAGQEERTPPLLIDYRGASEGAAILPEAHAGANWSLHLQLSKFTGGPITAAAQAAAASAALFCRDVGRGMLLIGHNAFATVGLVVVAALSLVLGEPQLRQEIETGAYQWLQDRYDARMEARGDTLSAVADSAAVVRVTAADLRDLTPQQARLASWISRRYSVAAEPVGALVREAYATGRRTRLDPTLILAVMAVESRFNPYAQSPVGAQGLMQVMTRVHDDKYEDFGGTRAAFDPITNLRVGVQVLKESISRGGGTVEEGLRYYVGAALLDNDRGYASKVMFEQAFMRQVAGGQQVATNVQAPPPVPRPALVPNLPEPILRTTAPESAPSTLPGGQLAQASTTALVR